MSTHYHLEEALQRDIDQLRRKVIEMAGLAERSVKASLQALTERNRQLAYSIILRDLYIDELETELDRLSLEFIVRHQPVAGHLRFVFAAIQINRELERVGDFAESVARQALVLSSVEPQPPYEKFAELANLSLHMLHNAVQAFLNRDADLAWRTMAVEDRANSLRYTINAETSSQVHAGQIAPEALQPLRTVSRRFEGVTDQAKNICEEVLYMCTGEFIKHKGADTFRVLFIDQTNSGLSQMAEGIGRSLNLPRFSFGSAGLKPQAIDSRVSEFMAGQGINLSRQSSKVLDEVPEWEHFQVLIMLGADAPSLQRPATSKAIEIKWGNVRELPADMLEPAAIRQHLEKTFNTLRTQIQELVGAVMEKPEPK